jgi:serine/threonine protein kinase
MVDGFPRKFGKYQLLAPLAQGGMGALYLAVAGDHGLEKLCVIKTVLPHLADSEYVSRFRDEAKVVVKLSHGNLVPVFDAGQVGGEIFLAMDFVEGKDLRAVWNRCAKKGVAFPVDVAVYLVKELCRGLAYAHGFGGLHLVHRDVSPPNVLVSFAGEVKLTDFGLASSTLKLEKTAPGVIYGKVSYMSPEQARGEPLDGRTDLYAAGIILWELLTGRQLYPPGEQQPQDLIARAKDPRPDPPSKRAPRVPPRLDEIVLKALAPDPAHRYQTGEEMRAALAGWLAQEAPATEAARVEKFITSLFNEDMLRERAERDRLVENTRDQVRARPTANQETTARVSPRAEPLPPAPMVTRKGVAVSVPQPGKGGATVVTGAALAATVFDSEPIVDHVGQVIDGRYKIRGLIGEGGMGRVYEAEHVEIGKRVAVKILHPVYTRTPEVVSRFRREARAASKIGHPNIVDVTDSGTTPDGSVYFVMEFLEGVELASVIDNGQLEVARALNIGAQICRALAAAHGVGVIHRDLKPENVFLVVREGTTDFVKVLDFGIAKSAELEEQRKERLTHPGMAMGTPEYMAPEQAAGRPADARSDIYAVGAILYEMLTGSPPYDGENFMEILTKKATQEPVAPRVLRGDLPEVVERVTMRALSRDPADRPPSMESLEYELTKCLAGRGVAVAKLLGMPVDSSMSQGPPPPMTIGEGGLPVPETSQRLLAVSALPSHPPLFAPTPEPGSLSASGSGPYTAPVNPLGFGRISATEELQEELQHGTPVAALQGTSGWVYAAYAIFLVAAAAGIAWYVYQQRLAETMQPLPTNVEPTPAKVSDTPPLIDKNAKPTPDVTPIPPVPIETRRLEGPEPPPGYIEGAPEASAPTEDHAADSPPDSPKAQPDAGMAPINVREAELLLTTARGAESKMQWVKARGFYERVARGKHKRAAGLLGLASVSWQTGDLDAAIGWAQKALDAGAGDSARIVMGHAYLRQKRFDQAELYYRTVLKTDNDSVEALRGLEAVKKAREK